MSTEDAAISRRALRMRGGIILANEQHETPYLLTYSMEQSPS